MYSHAKTFLLIICICETCGGVLGWTERGNNVLQQLTCSQLADSVRTQNVNTHKPLDVTGTWISTRCEVRSGPEFLLRKYTFYTTGRFHLVQFYYSDAECRDPAFSVEARGLFRPLHPSWTIRGGTELDYETTHVAVVAYTDAVAAALQNTVNSTCNAFHHEIGKDNPPWRSWERYVLLAYNANQNDDDSSEQEHGGRSDVDDVDNRVDHQAGDRAAPKRFGRPARTGDCAGMLELSLNELQLMRIEQRTDGDAAAAAAAAGGTEHGRRMLYLGDVHTDRTQRPFYRPQSYQLPLVEDYPAHDFSDCRVCAAVSESSAFYPPTLSPVVRRHHRQRAVAVRSVLPGSAWASDHCETRPYGVFLLRRLTFGWGAGRPLRGATDGGGDWTEQFDYFDDAICQSPTFTVRASGRYVVVGDASAFDDPDRIVDADFAVGSLSVTIWDQRLLEDIRMAGADCGAETAASWEIGVERDLTATGGCAALGLHAPTGDAVVPQLLAAERHHQRLLLLIGQPATPPVFPGGQSALDPLGQRPTSFQPPLRRCVPVDDDAWYGRRHDADVIASRTWRQVTSSSTRPDVIIPTVAAATAAAAALLWTSASLLGICD